MKTRDISKLGSSVHSSMRMPMLFVGHGNPMHAITQNPYAPEWKRIADNLPQPKVIVCISAHWETDGVKVTGMDNPPTIHDFGGFPQELYAVEYPAPGEPGLARNISESVKNRSIALDFNWGLDHGTWAVLRHMYPDATVPVIQISLNRNGSPRWHFEFAQELAFLRSKGALILGSGNIVHNLYHADFRMRQGHDWAKEADRLIVNLIEKGEYQQLVNYEKLGKEIRMAVPTPEHFLPLLYILALKQEHEKLEFFNQTTELGAVSMTSLFIESD